MSYDLAYVTDLIAIGGIGLEIWEFWWLLKYHRPIKHQEYQKWMKKFQNKHGVWLEQGEVSDLDIEQRYDREYKIQRSRVPKKLADEWDGRKNTAIKLVIIGLAGQIVNIVVLDGYRFFQNLQ